MSRNVWRKPEGDEIVGSMDDAGFIKVNGWNAARVDVCDSLPGVARLTVFTGEDGDDETFFYVGSYPIFNASEPVKIS